MPLGTQNTGGVGAATRITGAINPATKSLGGIRGGIQENLNVVVIILDDGGAEWFDWSGLTEPNAGHALTPRLNEMRERGVTFSRGYATPICGPSRARFLSSQWGFRAGLAGNIEATDVFNFGGGGSPLADWTASSPITLKMLPRLIRLGRNGTDASTLVATYTYQQALFGKAHLMSNTGFETWPVDHGFGRYIGMQPNAGALPVGAANTGHFHFTEISQSSGTAPTSKTWGSAGTWPAGGPYVAYDTSVEPDAAWDAYKVYRDAIQWINSRTSPFFAVLTFNPPHGPFEVPPYTAPDDVGYLPPGGTFDLIDTATQNEMTALDGGGKGPGYEGPDGASLRSIYRANIQAVDTLIGKLWDRMEPTRRDKTVFFFVGDNGTVPNAVDAPYEAGHAKRSAYEMGGRVPFVVWGPPSVITTPNRTSTHFAHIIDVMPTILELTLCDPLLWNPGNARKVDGLSFARVLRDPSATAARDHVFNETFSPLTATQAAGNIEANTWYKAISMDFGAATYRMIEKPANVSPRYELYRVDNAVQPASGLPGYFERAADNLIGLVGQSGQEALTAVHSALTAKLASVLAS